MGLLYLLIALIATIIGGLTGIGGGVIIKPVLDAFAHFDVASINILSSVTIFSMAVVSFIRHSSNGFKYSKQLLIIAFGAIIGGLIGKELFFFLTKNMNDQGIIIMQSSILALLLLVVLMKEKINTKVVHNVLVIGLLGIILGTTSSFLGIGGGPINVFVLHCFLDMNTKELTVGSIFIILLSQLSKLTSVGLTLGFSTFNLDMLIYMVPGGILGGLIGSYLLHKTHSSHIKNIFTIVIIVIIAINIFNIIKVI
ncbi:MAG: sulfite exporter TauE/SafE family protein [Clostridiales bacterium]|nr:sulfite exporter TauE/SafE family protein [Clostridiales bacterium]